MRQVILQLELQYSDINYYQSTDNINGTNKLPVTDDHPMERLDCVSVPTVVDANYPNK